MNSPIGKGPWARALGATLLGDSPPEAGDALDVHDLTIEVGLITADVGGCTVTLSTPRVPPRIWAAMTSYAANRGALERAITGETQSVQLEHLMTQDWDEPLVPPAESIVRTCSLDEDGHCMHLDALTLAVVDAIDDDPKMLLRWRGCVSNVPDEAVPAARDPWTGAVPPPVTGGQARPAGSVAERLGPSGIRVGDADLAEILRHAYASLGD